MSEIWGPGLDAELAYRREVLRADLADTRARRGARRQAKHPDGHRHASAAAARRWLLRGSGAWHVAR
ncbi:hypothetical protein [Cellulomonas rhizosphaerae]|jgi:hypothetical protein|uniref:Uncharacterized protein n=1 Tax=Cellulomonas rhizosphaerae TaxID=2293719 RepID=A0A413RND4_9CELL|nr:hypothetical protein [Cellulomonas rhizosphaerae]RHA43153.1 hypothetical protein D1825_06145 [Cellulomonas rhizosphaerae]